MSAPHADHKVKVVINGVSQTLEPGGVGRMDSSEVYRDAPDALVTQVRQDIESGIPWRESARHRLAPVNPWLYRVVAEASRSLWLEQHPPRPGSWVLDVGAGWGQWAVPAAKTARVVALEPTPARLDIIRAIARQEGCSDSMHFVGAPVQAVSFPDHRFDAIYCIGVLEWVPKFSPHPDPLQAQREFLRHLRTLLAPGGQCIVGIENRLGLKYLLGAPDDHTGISGISILDPEMAGRRYREKKGQDLRIFTHTLSEYDALLRDSGFDEIEFFAAFPDYKVPQAIHRIRDGSANYHCKNNPFIPEHDGTNGRPLVFQEELASHYRSLAQLECAGLFAPSFFISARISEPS